MKSAFRMGLYDKNMAGVTFFLLGAFSLSRASSSTIVAKAATCTFKQFLMEKAVAAEIQ